MVGLQHVHVRVSLLVLWQHGRPRGDEDVEEVEQDEEDSLRLLSV